MKSSGSQARKPLDDMNQRERQIEAVRVARETLDVLDRIHEILRNAVIGGKL